MRHMQYLCAYPCEAIMSIGTVFINNRKHAARLRLDVLLPVGVHHPRLTLAWCGEQ